MKTMTKEEAIQILSTRDAHGVLCGYTSGVTEALDMAIEALKEQEISNELQGYAYECGYEHFFHECQSCEHRRIGNKAQDWIPCSERLPEEGEKVLASTTNTVFTQVFKGTHGTSDSWWWNNNTIKTIYAWMPLPKPYREDGE